MALSFVQTADDVKEMISLANGYHTAIGRSGRYFVLISFCSTKCMHSNARVADLEHRYRYNGKFMAKLEKPSAVQKFTPNRGLCDKTVIVDTILW